MLLKAEYLMNENMVHISNYKTISIEHVLPQNPPKNSNWIKNFNEKQRESWAHKIGNLVLLSASKNSKLSNLDFSEKKEKYLLEKMDPFKSTSVFLKKSNSWTLKTIDQRHKKLVDLLVSNGNS